MNPNDDMQLEVDIDFKTFKIFLFLGLKVNWCIILSKDVTDEEINWKYSNSLEIYYFLALETRFE